MNLTCDLIYAEGAKTIFGYLKSNTTLRILNLDSNQIGDDGITSFSEIKLNSTLSNLSLRFNNISNASAKIICETVKTNSTLTKLNLEGAAFDKGTFSLLNEMLLSNQIALRVSLWPKSFHEFSSEIQKMTQIFLISLNQRNIPRDISLCVLKHLLFMWSISEVN
uniref:Uncharacterized protein n=1 Tax=Arcella intermedia TaxID=1963864 RepID=A0A6B2LJA6_9EUKA